MNKILCAKEPLPCASDGGTRKNWTRPSSQARQETRPPDEVAKLRQERDRTKAPFRTLAIRYKTSVWTAHKLCSGRREAER